MLQGVRCLRRGGMVAFDGSAEGLIAAALRLREEDEWRRILATIPIVDGNADVERWLDAHETAYASAIERAATRPRSS